MLKKLLSYVLAGTLTLGLAFAMPLSAQAADKVVVRSNEAGYWDLAKYDANEDNVVTASEVKNVKKLVVMTEGGLGKLKYFPKVKKLYITFFGSTSVDLSGNKKLKYIDCSFCTVDSLDVSNCPKLETLICINSKLQTLKFDNCTKLKELNCGENKLKELDVSTCPNIKTIRCHKNNFETLDVSPCGKLENLSCYGNDSLTNIRVSASVQKITCGSSVQVEGASPECLIRHE